MQDEVITIGGILIFANIISIVFAVYSHFKKPQEKNIVSIAVLNQAIEAMEKAFESKIVGLEKNINNLRDNHLHTIQGLSENIKQNGTYIHDLTKDMGELKGTIKIYFDKNNK